MLRRIRNSILRMDTFFATSVSCCGPRWAIALEPQIRHQVESVDATLPVYDVAAMDALLDRSLGARRFSAQLVGGFAGAALLLSSIGIYGVLAYMVGQRSREIGLRLALGAERSDILKMVLRRGLVLAGAGVTAGVIVL